MKIVWMNCSIITSEGFFSKRKTSISEIKAKLGFVDSIFSAVGHQSTAEIMSKLLGVEVECNRVNYVQGTDDIGVVFQLRKRPEEGKILSIKEIEEIGYDFYFLKKLPDSCFR